MVSVILGSIDSSSHSCGFFPLELSLMSFLPLYPRWWWTTLCIKLGLLLVVALRSSCGWLWEKQSVSWFSCPKDYMLLSASLYASHSSWTVPLCSRHFVHGPVVLFSSLIHTIHTMRLPLVDPVEKSTISNVNLLECLISPVWSTWLMRWAY